MKYTALCGATGVAPHSFFIGSSCCLQAEREQMERYRTLRAYSAGGVVFRLVPMRSSDQDSFAANKQGIEQETQVPGGDLAVEVALVGRSHAGIWTLPKGTPQAGETVEQVAVREVQEETGLKTR